MSNKDEQSFSEDVTTHDDALAVEFPEDIFPDIPHEEMSTIPPMDIEGPAPEFDASMSIDDDLISMSSQVEHELDYLRQPPH